MTDLTIYSYQNNEEGENNLVINTGIEWLRHIQTELQFGIPLRFLEASENIIKSKLLYRNELIIEEIFSHLNSKRVCLIRASEGRGKTYLSRIIAHQFYQESNCDVYFIDLRDNTIQIANIENKLIKWFSDIKKKYLLVLENAHGFSDIDNLIDIINKWRRVENCDNLYFLLNSRYTDERYDSLTNWSKDFIVKLNPKEKEIESIINIYENVINEGLDTKRQVIEQSALKEFINNNIFNNKKSNSWENVSANLRSLNIYLKIWQGDNKIIHITDISNNDIKRGFLNIYNYKNLSSTEKSILLYLSIVFQFDAPFYIDKTKDIQQYDFLNKLSQQGLCYKRGDYFYLAHSIDAMYLCKAICNYEDYNYVEKTTEYIKQYIDLMLNSLNPSLFENDFKKILFGLQAKADLFFSLLSELKDEKDKRLLNICKKLHPGYILSYLYGYEDFETNKAKLNFYLENKNIFKENVLNLNPILVQKTYQMLKKYYNYNTFLQDIFIETKDLCGFLDEITIGLKPIIFNEISNISEEHHKLVQYYLQNKKRNISENSFPYYFYTTNHHKYAFRIDRNYVKNFYRFSNVTGDITKMYNNGIYFYNLSWKHLGMFINKIIKSRDLSSNEIINKLIISIVNEVLKFSDSFKYATASQLSLFLLNVSTINEPVYEIFLKQKKVIEDAKNRLRNFTYTNEELYLLGHYFCEEWCLPLVSNILNNADNKQTILIESWFKTINSRNDIKKDTFGYFVQEFLLRKGYLQN